MKGILEQVFSEVLVFNKNVNGSKDFVFVAIYKSFQGAVVALVEKNEPVDDLLLV
jgi:hypothetical protein